MVPVPRSRSSYVRNGRFDRDQVGLFNARPVTLCITSADTDSHFVSALTTSIVKSRLKRFVLKFADFGNAVSEREILRNLICVHLVVRMASKALLEEERFKYLSLSCYITI